MGLICQGISSTNSIQPFIYLY